MIAANRFEIVFVCTGNRARSALAEALMRRRLPEDRFTVRSVGTLDLGDEVTALAAAIEAAALLGEDLGRHRARTLRRGELQGADLVIGFEPAHVSAAVVDGAAARERTFSIIELADLLDEGSSRPAETHSPGEAVERAAARRRGTFLTAPAIADPLGSPQEVFNRTAIEIDRLVDRIARSLSPSPVEQ
jgi:protein-tyrosine phosphatase